MNRGKVIGLVHNSMYQQVQKKGFATPVQVLIDLQYLSESDYKRWKEGRIDYLERVCKANLSKLSFAMGEVRAYARKYKLKPSFTFYKQGGRKLRFSKFGNENVEKGYATHYVITEDTQFKKKKKKEVTMEIIVKKPTEQEQADMLKLPTWECDASTFDWKYDQEETCLLIEGEVEVTHSGGSAKFSAGDMVTFPKGLSCVWKVSKPVKKHYIFK